MGDGRRHKRILTRWLQHKMAIAVTHLLLTGDRKANKIEHLGPSLFCFSALLYLLRKDSYGAMGFC